MSKAKPLPAGQGVPRAGGAYDGPTCSDLHAKDAACQSRINDLQAAIAALKGDEDATNKKRERPPHHTAHCPHIWHAMPSVHVQLPQRAPGGPYR